MTLEKDLLFANRYKLIKQLGRGGFSEVWLAEDSLTSVQIAVKVYAPGTGLDDQGIEMFTKEFSMVFDMNHTNLLRPTHFDCWERMPYLIMPYCKNGSAFSYIMSDKTISEKECWSMLHDVAAGLAYLHEKVPPLIHQDIKPDNILVSDEGHFMITDFGISARVRSTIRNGMAQEQSGGTMAYMGPERFSKNPTPIMASDVWSLGAMMYELMTNGHPPFENWGGAKQKNGAEIPDILENYSQELKDIVYACLALEPWDRPSARKVEEMTYNYLHGIQTPQQMSTEKIFAPREEQIPVAPQPVIEQPKPFEQAQPFEEPKPAEQPQPIEQPQPQPFEQPKPIEQPQPLEQPKQEQTGPIFTPKQNVKKSQPIKQNSNKGKLIGGIVAVAVLIGILVAIFSGGSESKEQPAVVEQRINYDSLAQAKIQDATAIRMEADTIISNHPDDKYDSKYNKVEEIYVKALNTLDAALAVKDSLSSDVAEAALQQKVSICNALKIIYDDFKETINAFNEAGIDPSVFESRSKLIEPHIEGLTETSNNEPQNNEN